MFKKSLLFFLAGLPMYAQLSESAIDDLVNRSMKAFNVPGIAVGVVKDGQLIYAKGHGVRSIHSKEKVDANTLFGIASNSKAFTAASLGVLVDEGKITWDDKVIQHIPEFKMYNDYVTQEFTIRDLLTHRSGLGLGAGDLMVWPDGNDFTVQDIVNNLHYLKPVSAFRTKYDYDNLLYIVAGEVVARVTGKSWEQFTEERLIQPLGMNKTAATFTRLKDSSNVIVPHVPVDGKLKTIPRYKLQQFNAAAGLYSNVNDLSKWLIANLNEGQLPDGKPLLSKKVLKEMWTPQTIQPNKPMPPYNTQFKTYGLGWVLQDVNGKLQVSHTGGLEGIVTQTIMIPELKLGIIVLTNQQSGSAFNSISNTIKDSYLGLPAFDHVADLEQKLKSRVQSADVITVGVWKKVDANLKNKKFKNLEQYAGTFKDNWFGDATLTYKKGKLYFASKRSKWLTGEVFHVENDTLVVKWDRRTFEADAYLFFDGLDHLTMKPISPLTDFSYDFQDLDFKRVK